MNLPAPDLDHRRFDDLVREARARIPRYTPEWTNFNDSDPGMTLVKLHAWMTETILYELNRVPELNYVKFLDLLGIVPRPAYPARTELTFALEKLDATDDPLVVNVPRQTKVAVDDPDLEQEVTFETDRTLTGVNAAIGAVLAPKAGGSQSRQLVTFYEDDAITWPHSFESLSAGTALYLGLVLRPIRKEDDPSAYAEDRFPVGPLDVYADAVRVLDPAPSPAPGAEPDVVTGPIGLHCPAPGSRGVPPDHVTWQVYTGDGTTTSFEDDDNTDWTRLSVSSDGTAGLAGSGHLVLEMPPTARPLDPSRLSQDFWQSFGAIRPPRTTDELVAQLFEGTLVNVEGLADHWEAMGASPGLIDEVAACGGDPHEVATTVSASGEDLDPTEVSLGDWLKVDPGYGAPLPTRKQEAYRRLYWVRAVLGTMSPDVEAPTAMRGFHLNTVSATQRATRLDDRLGRSDARPAQQFMLPRAPVLVDPDTGEPDLDLQIPEEGQDPAWLRVDDFHGSGPEDPHYVLDPQSGRITLGDGRRGRIPVAGSQVVATRYGVGGGAIGNVGAGLVTKIKGRLRDVAAVTNPRPAHDGRDGEPLDEVKLRAPHDLRTRDRAVTADDFADLAQRTPGVALHSVVALARRAVTDDEDLVEKDGSVTLLVLPASDALTPQPDEDQKRAICRWLEPRRLLTTELHITGPRYAVVTRLSARLSVRSDHDLGTVQSAVYDALLQFLDPFVGGEDGTGWPMGQDIYYGDIYERILAVPGVRRAWELSVSLDEITGNAGTDVATLAEGHLPALSRDAIDMVAAYG
jgi:hypothetical protein